MCGIVGFIGNREAAPVVLNALKKLEYRGYDSAGLATVGDGGISLRKGIGKLDRVQREFGLDSILGKASIGHVRWATHGGVSKENAHPHLDCGGQIAIVHNGIIENHQELRLSLEEKGHKFSSDTDSEVISHLIEDGLANGASCLQEAVIIAGRKLRGSYAVLAISSAEPGKIVALRKDSPLVIGIGKGGHFVASDALCFLSEAGDVIYLEDDETAVLTSSEINLLDATGKLVKREPERLDIRWNEASKQGQDYFMLKEILEQPQSIRHALIQDKGRIMKVAKTILGAKQVVLTACGTSRYAALIGRYVFSKLTGKLIEVVMASEFGYFADSVDKDTLVIAISQSGETADVIQGVKKAKEKGAKIISLVNMVGSTLARMSDEVIYLNCGPEVAVAATKSFISQLTVFYLLAFAATDRFEEGAESLKKVSYSINNILDENGHRLSRLAKSLKDKEDFYYIARGINFAIAGEGALKLKEISYIHAEGLPAGELKHSTLALIEEGTPVVVICSHDYTYNETIANATETKARGAFVIGLSDKPDKVFDEWIRIPSVEELFYPLVSIIPLQFLAYYLATAKGLDPDKPRNLAKSVTVL